MNLSDINNITIDKDFEISLTLNEMLAAMVYLNHDIYYNGVLIGRIDRDTARDYPEIMGKTVEEYATEYILSKSPDGTIEAGLDEIARRTGEDPVGWMSCYVDTQLANEYNRQNGREPVEIFEEWKS